MSYDPYNANVPPRKTGLPVWGWLLIGCGVLPFLVVPILAAILFPVFAQAREKARQTACLSNVKQLGLATLMYSQDYDDVLPLKSATSSWPQLLKPYLGSERPLRCPSVPQLQVGYAMNGAAFGKKRSKVASPESLPLLFDAKVDTTVPGATMLWGDPDFLTEYRHGGKKWANVVYLDGHAKARQGPTGN